MTTTRKRASRRQTRSKAAGLVSSLAVIQQISLVVPAQANNFGHMHSAQAPATPANHSSAWQSQPLAASHVPTAHSVQFLPAAFGYGVASLPQTHHANDFQSNLHTHFQSQALTAPVQSVQLDLTSAGTAVRLSNDVIHKGDSVTINIGGNSVTYHPGDLVTAGELVAIEQAQGRAGQTIQLDTQGRATGGTFSLNNVTTANAGVSITGVVVPANVTAIDKIIGHSEISLSGNLVNYGSILEVGRGTGHAGNITALDIINQPSGSITAKSYGGGLVDLNLIALQDFTNLGSITASGALNVFTGSGNIVNAGSMASTGSNVTLALASSHTPSQALNIDNSGGRISALNGAINIRQADYSGTGCTSLNGGDLLSRQLNLNAGAGVTDVNVNSLTGQINSTGNAVHVQASTQNLKLGSQTLSGDPVYYNNGGDITLDGDIVVNEDLVIAASGSVIGTSKLTKIEASDGLGHGANITIVAGADITGGNFDPVSTIPPLNTNTTGSVSIAAPAGTTGGDIDLSKAAVNLSIKSASTLDNANGGNVTLAAFDKTGTKGLVLLPVGSTIDASPSGTATGGDVLILGAYSGGGKFGVKTGSIIGAHDVEIAGTAPSFATTGGVTYNTVGKVTNGNAIVRNYTTIVPGSVEVGGPVTASGKVSLAGDSVEMDDAITATGPITATANDTLYIGGSLTGGSKGITLVSFGDILTIGGKGIGISTDSATAAGNINLIAGTTFKTTSSSQILLTGQSPIGGNVLLNSNPINKLSAIGTAPGATGGNITLLAQSAKALPSQEGAVVVPNAVTVSTGGGVGGTNGDVMIIGGNSTKANTTIGSSSSGDFLSVSTNGGTTGTGNVTLSNSTPDFTSNVAVNTQSSTVNQSALANGTLAQSQMALGTISTPSATATMRQGGGLTTSGFATTSNLVYVSDGKINVAATTTTNALAVLTTGDISVDGAVDATGGILLVAGGDVSNSLAGIKIGTSSTSVDTGSITIAAGAAYSENGQLITLKGPSATGGSIKFDEPGLAIGGLSTSSLAGSATTAGDMTLLAFANAKSGSGTVSVPAAGTVLTASGFGASGDITIIAGAKSGTAISTGSLTANGSSSTSSGNLELQAAQPNVTNLVYHTNGSAQLASSPVNDDLATYNPADIATGTITSKFGNVQVTTGGNVRIAAIDAAGVDMLTDSGGFVKVITASATNPLLLESTTGLNYIGSIDVSGALGTNGSGGEINITQKGNQGITLVDGKSLNYNSAGTGAFKGGNLFLNADQGILNLGAANQFNSSTNSPLNGGTISFTALKATTTSGGFIGLNATGSDKGGVVSVVLNGTDPVALGLSKGNFALVAEGGGGLAILSALNAPLTVGFNGIDVFTPAASTSKGGTIVLDAKGIKTAGSNIPLNADGSNTTSGGVISVHDELVGTLVIGGGANSLQLSAQGGTNGGSGGTISVQAAGNLTIDPAFVKASQHFSGGNGGSYDFAATGNLLILGSLNAAGGSSGSGGSISLASNSKTAFTINGTKLVNGVNGTLTTIGGTLTPATGAITITNHGAGGIINNTSAIGTTGKLTEGSNGPIKATTVFLTDVDQVDIATGKGGAISFTAGIIANTLNVSSDTAAITLTKLDVRNFSAFSSGAVSATFLLGNGAPVNITGGFSDNGFKVISVRPVTVSGNILADGISIGAIGANKVAMPLIVNKQLTAINGGISLTSSGAIQLNSALSATSTVKIIGTSPVDDINMTGSISTGSTVAIGSKRNITFAAASDISGKSVGIDASKGFVMVGGMGALKRPDSILIKSLDDITFQSKINFVTKVTAIASGKGAGQGDILIGNTINGLPGSTMTLTSGAASVVNDNLAAKATFLDADTVTITGHNSVTFNNMQIFADVHALTVTSDKGFISIGKDAYLSANDNATVLSALTNILIDGQVNGCTATTLKATGTTVPSTVTVSSTGMVTAAGPGGKLTLSAVGTTGSGIIIDGKLESTSDLALTASKGQLTTGSGSTIKSDSGKATLTSLYSMDSGGSIDAYTGAFLAQTGKTFLTSLKVGNVQTHNGPIKITGSGATLTTATGTTIKADTIPGSKVKATVTIADTLSLGKVTIDSTILTSGPGGSYVTIAAGAAAATTGKNPVTSFPGQNITIVQATPVGQVFAGANPTLILGPAVGTATLTNKGANIILNAATVNNSITFAQNAAVTADPPTVVATSIVAPPVRTTIAQVTISPPKATPAVYFPYASAQQSSFNPGWISRTELAGGKIPTALYVGKEIGMGKSEAVRLGASNCSWTDETKGRASLTKGSLLSAPTVDTTIRTTGGELKIKAGSLVLVMAVDQGIAVYNLHDSCSNAVVLKHGDHDIAVMPGKSIFVTSAIGAAFEQLNPAQLICYGPMSESTLTNKSKMFHSSFSPMSAINAVPALREMITSNHPQARRLASSFLKTAAIIMQLTGSMQNYRQIIKPQLTAYNQ